MAVQAGASSTATWMQALSAASLLSGATIEERDGEVCVSRNDVCAFLLAAPVSADAIIARLESSDCGVLALSDAPAWLERLPPQAPFALLPTAASPAAVCLALHGLLERLELRRKAGARAQLLARYRYERGELVEIARAITRERDIDRLLGLILEKSRYVTGADAGSIYVVEGAQDEGGPRLHFKLSQNDSIAYESSEFTIPVSQQSIAGAAVLGRQPINIADVYDLDPKVPYRFDPSFDQRMGYRTVSMLTVPMISAEDEVIGVIQLINKKRDPQIPLPLAPGAEFEQAIVGFDAHSEELLSALSAQAGIALENALLYEEIRRIFEGFVRASVQAIEQRDPTTSGHSLRVSVLSCRLAERVDGASDGPFADVRFSRRDLQELKYAALLHDFGKIGVREQVLVKAKKLYPHERDAIRARVEFALKSAEVQLLERKLDLQRKGAGGSDLQKAEHEFAARKIALLDAWSVIERADEPSVLSEGDFSRIAEIGAIGYETFAGDRRPLLDEQEMVALQITRGSLSPAEIEEIRSHVVHTYNFLTHDPLGQIDGAHPDDRRRAPREAQWARLSARRARTADPAAVQDHDRRRHLRCAHRGGPPVQEGARPRPRARDPRLRGQRRQPRCRPRAHLPRSRDLQGRHANAGVLRWRWCGAGDRAGEWLRPSCSQRCWGPRRRARNRQRARPKTARTQRS